MCIWVENASQMQDLVFFKDMIKEKINRYLDMNWVKRIRFTQDLSRYREAKTVLKHFFEAKNF